MKATTRKLSIASGQALPIARVTACPQTGVKHASAIMASLFDHVDQHSGLVRAEFDLITFPTENGPLEVLLNITSDPMHHWIGMTSGIDLSLPLADENLLRDSAIVANARLRHTTIYALEFGYNVSVSTDIETPRSPTLQEVVGAVAEHIFVMVHCIPSLVRLGMGIGTSSDVDVCADGNGFGARLLQ
jgi:hypothetical protein